MGARAAEPGTKPKDDHGPFRLEGAPGEQRGVLLVHGFTGSPFELRPLGESLAARGLHVDGIALPGHGLLDGAALRDTSWEEWSAAVARGFDALRERAPRVGVGGLSMGGLLALDLALSRGGAVRSLALMATALWLPEWQMKGLRKVSRSRLFSRFGVPKLGGADVGDPGMQRRIPSRDLPFRALGQMIVGMDRVRPRIGEIDRPALVAHGALDRTIPPACSEALAKELRGPIERVDLPRSRHVITLDVERDVLLPRVVDFFLRTL